MAAAGAGFLGNDVRPQRSCCSVTTGFSALNSKRGKRASRGLTGWKLVRLTL